MSKLKDATMIDATEERKNRMNGESVYLHLTKLRYMTISLSMNYKLP